VGNFGNGRIHAYDATTGHFMATIKDPDGEPIEINGLWGLRVGNGKAGGDASKVYFTAGIDDEKHGLFGSLTSVAKGTDEGPAEAQMVQADLDVVQLDLTAVLTDISTGAPASQLQIDLQTLNTDISNLVNAEIKFTIDESTDHFHSGKSAADLSGAARGQFHHALDTIFAELATLEHELS